MNPNKKDEKISEEALAKLQMLAELLQPKLFIFSDKLHCEQCQHVTFCYLARQTKWLISSMSREYWLKKRTIRPVEIEELTAREVSKNIEDVWMTILALYPHFCVFYKPREAAPHDA